MIITLTKPPTNFIGKGEKILEKYLNSQEFVAIDRSSYEKQKLSLKIPLRSSPSII